MITGWSEGKLADQIRKLVVAIKLHCSKDFFLNENYLKKPFFQERKLPEKYKQKILA